MSLRNYIENNLICCSPENSVRDVARLMKEKDVGAVVICEGDNPTGIVTDRDIVLRCVSEELDCEKAPVRDIMTHSVDTVKADRGIQDVIRHMKEEEVRRVVVVDEKGKAIGLISFGDIVAMLARELSELAVDTHREKGEHMAEAA